MQYEEEIQGRKLHAVFTTVFSDNLEQVEIKIEGVGVYWACELSNNKRLCHIDCQGRFGYQVSFMDLGQMQVKGRTADDSELISSVRSWIEGSKPDEMYEEYRFLDRTRMILENIRDEVLSAYPEIDQCAEAKIVQKGGELYYLWFITAERACKIYLYPEGSPPAAEFYWDENLMFKVPGGKDNALPGIIKRWLCDFDMPSGLKQEFPWIEPEKPALCYEQGRHSEGEFMDSWDSAEQYYREMVPAAQNHGILELISRLREKGFDKTFLAERSLHTLILSRFRRPAPGKGGVRVVFDFYPNGMDVINIENDHEEKKSFPAIGYYPEMDRLLKRLAAKAVDQVCQFQG